MKVSQRNIAEQNTRAKIFSQKFFQKPVYLVQDNSQVQFRNYKDFPEIQFNQFVGIVPCKDDTIRSIIIGRMRNKTIEESYFLSELLYSRIREIGVLFEWF